MAVTMKNAVFWDVMRVALVRTDVSEERRASIMKVTRVGELGTLAVTSKACCEETKTLTTRPSVVSNC
jgi:hypothetical protein